LVDVDHRDHEALLAIDPLTGRGVAVARYIQLPAIRRLSKEPSARWRRARRVRRVRVPGTNPR
jgi:hypothetical protein